MFIGHYAAAFVGKRVTMRPSLGWLFAACQLPDLIWPILVLARVERVSIDPGNTAFTPLSFDHYPWSHSLAMCVFWGIALGALYLWLRKDRRGALLIGALVVSHWLLDFLTHRPDLPLYPGNPTLVGMALWDNVPAAMAIETLFYVGAVALYATMTTALDRVGSVGFWVLVAFLFGTYLANAFGPPPPNATMVATSALLLWVLVPIAAWVDRHRSDRVIRA